MTEFNPWQYQARVFEVVDGDTLGVEFDKGHDIHQRKRVRILGIDTREIHFVSHDSEEYQRGMLHKEFVEDWLREHREVYDGEWPFVAISETDDAGKYGRYLVNLRPKGGEETLARALLDEFDDVEVY